MTKTNQASEKKGKHSVLFVCLGNICRSPAAEGIMKARVGQRGLADEFDIDSAGIGGWHIGQLPDPRMRQCGVRHGYKFDSHARQIDKEDLKKFDFIVVMDRDNYRAVTALCSNEIERRKVACMADFLRFHREYTTVPDPYYGQECDFDLVITLLEDAIDPLINMIIGKE